MSAVATPNLDSRPAEVPAPPARMAPVMPQVPEDIGLDELKELMRSVNETAASLQATHAALHQQVARLQDELAEANAQLRRSRSLAALGEMAAGIAHEIRNPLGSIQLYVQMLAEDLSDRPQQGQLCEKIDRAVTGLDSIVRDVLLFAREMKCRPTLTSGRELIDRALTGCESLIAGGAVDVNRQSADRGSIRLHADEGLMTQALGNVIRNAVEAMVETEASLRRLRLDISRRRMRCPDGKQAQRVVFAVEDTGPGIPPEVIDRMFNPFFTTRATGTGLGLAIVHRIVDAHGGHVNVRNIRHSGALIELCLPSKPLTGDRRKNAMFPQSADEALELARGVRKQIVMEEST
ncbi:MAG: hypothetical protein JSV91_05420 [Phycisphaerales bacterium]|nr:MAG: hypothetical protein JSV91_05420 [Phycisphaerales bacterium]